MKEQDTLKAILTLLRAHRIPAWRMNTGAFVAEHKGTRRFHRFGAKGMADILGVFPITKSARGVGFEPMLMVFKGDTLLGLERMGRFLAIEVKQPGKKATPEQQRFLDEVTHAGGLAFVAHSVEDAQKALGL